MDGFGLGARRHVSFSTASPLPGIRRQCHGRRPLDRMARHDETPISWAMVQRGHETPRNFDKIVLDNTWACWDSPGGYSVSVSNDGTNWGTPVATGAGQLGMTTITFPEQTARYIRITQTGTNATYHWSIYEFDVCKTRPVSRDGKRKGAKPERA